MGVYHRGMTEQAAGPTVTPRDPRLDAWRAFLGAHARLFRRLDDELRVEHDLSLPEYDALLHLAEAPERRLRMSRLAGLVLLSKSGVTRLIDRLEADGSVERLQCAHDARGAEAVLTDEGLDRLRRASRTHLRGVQRYFVDILGPTDLAAVERTMNAVARATGDTLEAACEPPAAAAAGRTAAPRSG
jgi:DNA-binding MarR family transcriptional regulator